jgi:hypothetical protein
MSQTLHNCKIRLKSEGKNKKSYHTAAQQNIENKFDLLIPGVPPTV